MEMRFQDFKRDVLSTSMKQVPNVQGRKRTLWQGVVVMGAALRSNAMIRGRTKL
jgi:hypothetical protein